MRSLLRLSAFAAAVLCTGMAGCSAPPPAATPDRSTADGHLQGARNLAAANRLTEALAEAEKAKKADPTLGRAYLLRAEIFGQSSHFREAREELLAAHRALPNDFDVMIALLFDTQSYFPPAEFEALARKAQTLDPNSSTPHYFLGLAIVNGGDPGRLDEALKEFETANRMDPAATPTLVEMAKIHLQKNDPQRALAMLESAAMILDEATKQGTMPLQVLQDWLRERRSVAFWSADALRKLKRTAESKVALTLANRLSEQTSELRALQSRAGSDPPDEAARNRLQHIAQNGF